MSDQTKKETATRQNFGSTLNPYRMLCYFAVVYYQRVIQFRCRYGEGCDDSTST